MKNNKNNKNWVTVQPSGIGNRTKDINTIGFTGDWTTNMNFLMGTVRTLIKYRVTKNMFIRFRTIDNIVGRLNCYFFVTVQPLGIDCVLKNGDISSASFSYAPVISMVLLSGSFNEK